MAYETHKLFDMISISGETSLYACRSRASIFQIFEFFILHMCENLNYDDCRRESAWRILRAVKEQL